MATVYISLGSNINRESNIRQAEKALEKEFGDLEYSPLYETEAVGFDGDNFYNSVVAFKTERDVHYVARVLKTIEDDFGRDRQQPKFSARIIDLDLLLFDDLILRADGIHIPREEILYNAFVLKPLVDIAGAVMHPELHQTFQAIWQNSKLQDIPLIEIKMNREL